MSFYEQRPSSESPEGVQFHPDQPFRCFCALLEEPELLPPLAGMGRNGEGGEEYSSWTGNLPVGSCATQSSMTLKSWVEGVKHPSKMPDLLRPKHSRAYHGLSHRAVEEA